MKQAIILSCVAILFLFIACKKGTPSEAAECSDGFVYWGGGPELDGIGWYFAEKRELVWEPRQLKEAELPVQYQRKSADSSSVSICLVKTNEKAPNGLSPRMRYYYKIKSIKSR
jgi:hypothetical protein